MVKNYVPRTVKLEKDDNERLMHICRLNQTDVSTFMRAAILEKLNSGAVSNVAGRNKIAYNSSNDTFTWGVQLDDGKDVEVLRNLSFEFMQDLVKKMQIELDSRESLLKKSKKVSIAIPKGLVK